MSTPTSELGAPGGGGRGVMLTAHGSVDRLDELPEFLLRIRRGRPVPEELLNEVRRRYAQIGGSPFLSFTQRQAKLLSQSLDLPVFVGMRLSRPGLEDALLAAQHAGVASLVVLPLAPYSVHVYTDAAESARALSGAQTKLVPVAAWGEEPDFIEPHVSALRAAVGDAARQTAIIFSVHSLPIRVAASDPYVGLVQASARAISEQLGSPVSLAFQSPGRDGGNWLSPDIHQALRAARRQGARRVVVDPLGFVCDHLETLYDLDIEARAWASELGLEFSRVPALNDSPQLTKALASVALRAFAQAPSPQPQ